MMGLRCYDGVAGSTAGQAFVVGRLAVVNLDAGDLVPVVDTFAAGVSSLVAAGVSALVVRHVCILRSEWIAIHG